LHKIIIFPGASEVACTLVRKSLRASTFSIEMNLPHMKGNFGAWYIIPNIMDAIVAIKK